MHAYVADAFLYRSIMTDNCWSRLKGQERNVGQGWAGGLQKYCQQELPNNKTMKMIDFSCARKNKLLVYVYHASYNVIKHRRDKNWKNF